MLKRFFRLPVDDVLSGMGHVMVGTSPGRAMAPMIITMIATWFVYVPIHELLHAYGCVWTGGEISTLEIKSYYFGNLMKEYFPFVVVGSDYAGRLSGFDTKANDWIYLATVFAPFTLSVLFGVCMLRLCTKSRRTWLFGPSIVLGMAPFYNIQGDYYEMASIMITRVLTMFSGGGHPPRFEGLRSDDIFTLFPMIVTEPTALGLDPGFTTILFALLVAIMGVVLSILLAFATYQLGGLVANAVVGPPTPFSMPKPKRRRRRRKKPETSAGEA
ncbi:MAG: hypothetical protein ACYTHJ_10270 [Planctomycetota bacterium]